MWPGESNYTFFWFIHFGNRFQIIHICLTYSVFPSLMHRQWMEGLAFRIWSPFYCRACFPKDSPPQREWTMITLEEPMGWEEKTGCCETSKSYLVSVIYAVMRNGWTKRQSLSTYKHCLMQQKERKIWNAEFSMCLQSKYSFYPINYCHQTISWSHWS